MPFLLDTNTWIFHLKHPKSVLAKRLASFRPSDIYSCSVVKAELFHGARRYGMRQRRLEIVAYLLAPYESLPFDDKAAEVYGALRHALEVSGQVIGPHDLLIASICLANNLTIVTNNVAEFSRIPSLPVQDWTTP